MQVVAVGTPPQTSRPAGGTAEGVAEGVPASADAAAAAAPPSTAAPLRERRRERNPQANTQAAGAQQTLNYLSQLEQRLQQLRNDLSRRIAEGSAHGKTDTALTKSLKDVSDTWQARVKQTAGHLDSQLQFVPDAGSRQRFKVRGVSAATLANGERETLTFSAHAARRTMPVTVEAGAPLKTTVRGLDRALAPADVRVTLDAQGEPVFNVAESAWPGVRDTLAVKGNGIRFPSGNAHHVTAEPEAAALQPTAWRSDDITEMRRALNEVTQALERIRKVAESVRRALDADSGTTVDDAAWARAFATGFADIAANGGYGSYSAVAPALTGLNRSRVMSLLSLD